MRIAILLVALALVSYRAEAQGKSKFFDSEGACLAALRSGDFAYYTPVDTTRRAKNPATGSNKKVAPLEADACVHMVTTAGWQTVVRHSGSNLRWELINGTWSAYADDECGNDADRVVYLPPVLSGEERFSATSLLGPRRNPTVNFPSQLGIKVDVTVRDSTQRPPVISLPPPGKGFWCFRGVLQGLVCTTVGTVVVYGGVKGIEALFDSGKNGVPPGGHTDPAFLWGRLP